MMMKLKKPIITYDFDGVLHTSMNPIKPPAKSAGPISYTEWNKWVPFKEMHECLKEDSKNSKIIIVTKRYKKHKPHVQKFIEKFNLPVLKIICTNMKPKWPTLKKINSIKHYDDSSSVEKELLNKPIAFIKINPYIGI